MTARYIVRDLVGGILVSLPSLLSRVPQINFPFVRFRDVRFNAGHIMGVPVPVFERLSRDLNGGLIISSEDLDSALLSDSQMIDGVIEFVSEDGSVLLRLECVDATQWELTTDNVEIASQLERKGFVPTDM